MKALLIGSSFSAAPIFEAMRAVGAHVTVVGRDRGDPCHAHADASVFEDYSDRETLLEICRNGDFEYIVPSCNDYAYMSATYVADRLGYPGFDAPEVADILHTKDAYREKLGALRIPSPRKHGEFGPEIPVDSLQLEMPVIVKPVDSFSGRGVQVVRDPADLAGAVERAFEFSRQKRVLAEQFVEGRLYSHTAFIDDGHIFWHDFADEFCDIYPYAVDRSVFPSSLPQRIKSDVHDCICRLVEDMKVNDGLMHTQFIASREGFRIIECMRRCPGDLYGHQIELACGIDYARLYMMPFMGMKYDAEATMPPAARRIERRILAAGRKRPFFSVALAANGCAMEFVPLKESGGVLDKAPFDKAGILFCLQEQTGGTGSGLRMHPQGYGQLNELKWS